MQSDPLYPYLSSVLAACPDQAGPLFTAFRDLALSVEWRDLRALELEGTGWAVILGHKRREDTLKAVLPLPLHTTSLRPSSLRAIFLALSDITPSSLPPPIPPVAPSLDELRRRVGRTADLVEAAEPEVVEVEVDAETLYMAISTTDSSVVYYKITKGIKKPADIPDE